MSSDENKITISIQISIPFDGRPVEVKPPVVEPGLKPPVTQPPGQPDPPRLRLFSISQPAQGQTWNVKVTGSGTDGVICASGQADDADAVLVKAHCFVGYTAPADPPGTAVSQTLDASKVWFFNNVPGARAGTTNLLKVWYFDALGNRLAPHDLTFSGVAATQTSCDPELPAPSAPLMLAKRVHLPVVMTAVTMGFSPEVSQFNGEWKLTLSPDTEDGNTAVWQLRVNCPKAVQVELKANLLNSSAVLLLRHQATEIRYCKDPGEWNPINVGEYSQVRCRAIAPGASVPAIVQVRPGGGE